MRRGTYQLRAQSTLEYSLIVACLAGALLAMQIYIKRGIQGRLRTATDEIGEHYAPKNIDSDITSNQTSYTDINSTLVDLKDEDGNLLEDEYGYPIKGIETTVEVDENVQRSGYEELGEYEDELF